jgi:hypothetical protein
MFVGRATTFMVGLAVILALTVGVTGAAFGANGANFLLGKSNTANAITQLVGSVAGPGLQIDNNSTDAAATALDLQVEAGKAPMKVNSDAQVAKSASSTLILPSTTGLLRPFLPRLGLVRTEAIYRSVSDPRDSVRHFGSFRAGPDVADGGRVCGSFTPVPVRRGTA